MTGINCELYFTVQLWCFDLYLFDVQTIVHGVWVEGGIKYERDHLLISVHCKGIYTLIL